MLALSGAQTRPGLTPERTSRVRNSGAALEQVTCQLASLADASALDLGINRCAFPCVVLDAALRQGWARSLYCTLSQIQDAAVCAATQGVRTAQLQQVARSLAVCRAFLRLSLDFVAPWTRRILCSLLLS